MSRSLNLCMTLFMLLSTSVPVISCGYRPLLGGEKKPLAVPLVGNETSYAGLSQELTRALRKRLASYGVNVSAGGNGVNRLVVTIHDVSVSPGAVAPSGGRLTTAAEDWEVSVGAVLEDSMGVVIWESEDLEETVRRPVTAGVVGSESLADAGRKDACSRLAHRIALTVLEHL